MNKKPLKKILVIVILTGIATFISLSLMAIAGQMPEPAEYPNEEGFNQAIYWYELAKDGEEVFRILGDPKSQKGKEIRSAMDAIHSYDFAFMICYSLFFASLFFMFRNLLNKENSLKGKYSYLFFSGIILCIIMYSGDMLETCMLLELTKYQSAEEIAPAVITALKVGTRIKWLAIFIACILMAYNYTAYLGKSWGLVLPLLYFIAAITGVASISFESQRYLLEISGQLPGLCWFLSLLHAGLLLYKTSHSTA